MKTLGISLLCIILTVSVFSQDKKELAEKKAIEKLIHKEVNAFLEKDWELFESCWLHEPYSRHFVTSKSAFNGRIGWESMKKLMSQGYKTEGSRGFTGEKTNIDIQVFGDAAYVTMHDNFWSTSEDDPWRILAINNAFFVKREDEWKFVCMNIVNSSSFKDSKNHRVLIEEFLETISGKEKTEELLTRYIAQENTALIEQNIMVEQAFPMYELTAEEILVDGNRVVVRGSFRGVQHGPYGSIAPTGNEVKMPVVLFYTLENGKITDYTVTYDNASMLRQLGVLD